MFAAPGAGDSDREAVRAALIVFRYATGESFIVEKMRQNERLLSTSVA